MIQRILDLFQPGHEVFLPSGSGEIAPLATALAAAPIRLAGVAITSCLIPGVNRFDYSALHSDASLTVFLLPPDLRDGLQSGRVKLLPLAYSGIVRHLRSRAPFDIALAHVAPPDGEGRASLGVSADFSALAWNNARFRVAVVNAQMPAMPRGPRLSLAKADLVIEIDAPLVTFEEAETTPVLAKIAALAANEVVDGASLQIGVGAAPSAMWQALTSHKNLQIASGLVSKGVFTLARAGALARQGHVAGIALGDAAFYRALAEEDLVRFAGADETHNVTQLAIRPNFTALNSALEVDLFGQVNLEWSPGALGYQLASGVGGAPDFVKAAQMSAGGRSILVLPATAKSGRLSRIVPKLQTPTVSLARSEIDTVVTEYGVARLRDRSVTARAEALISVAAPEFRDDLAKAWRERV